MCSPTPVSGASPDFRNRGSDSLPGRPLSHYNHWRPRPTVSLDAEASESSESDDCDNYHLSRSPGQDAQLRRPPVMVHGRDSTGVDNTNTPTQVVAALGSTDRLGSPQPFTQVRTQLKLIALLTPIKFCSIFGLGYCFQIDT